MNVVIAPAFEQGECFPPKVGKRDEQISTDRELLLRLIQRSQGRRAVETFLEEFAALARTTKVQKTIDHIFDFFDSLLVERDFALANRIIARMNADSIQPVFLAAILSITKPARDRLPARKSFADKASEAVARQRGDEEARKLLDKYL